MKRAKKELISGLEFKLVVRPTAAEVGTPYGIYENNDEGKLVREITDEKYQAVLEWLDEYKKKVPSLLVVVDMLFTHSNLEDIDEARAIAAYWVNLRGL